ncbi:hypothetical protein CS8_002240 [Cupriavidus sp. 8B]
MPYPTIRGLRGTRRPREAIDNANDRGTEPQGAGGAWSASTYLRAGFLGEAKRTAASVPPRRRERVGQICPGCVEEAEWI